MSDVRESPYAPWLEDVIKGIMAEQPTAIGVCMLLPTGDAATIYYGQPDHQEVALMAYHMNLDATMAVIHANADSIVSAAEDIEEGEEDNGTDYSEN